jgi:MEMO1 family protein
MEELDDIDIEISVLTPMKHIQSIDEFELGKQGIFMRKGYHTGTFLPQVADDDSDGKMPPTCKDTKYQIEKSKIG